MRVSSILPTVAACTLAGAQIASAADLPRKAPAPVPYVYNWTGLYVGSHIGMTTAAMDTGPFVYNDDFAFGKGDASQVLTGFHGGYNYQVNNFVLGVEGDFNFKYGQGFFAPVNVRIVSPWDASIRARLGFLATSQSLIYATGGFAFGHFKTKAANDPNINADGDNLGSPDMLGGTRTGWTVGAGIQHALDQNWSTRIEYRYTDWGTKTVSWSTGDSGAGPFVGSASSDLKDHRINLGLSYMFGGTRGPFAAAMPLKAPPAALAAYNWSGFYVGGQVGASAANMHVSGTDVGDNTGPDTGYGSFAQVLAGGHVGYNYQINNFVAGIESDLNAKFGGGVLDNTATKLLPKSNWDGSVRARLGLALTPRSLAYVTGGVAFGHFTTPLHEDDPSDAMEVLGGTRTGWTVGSGVQYALDSNWSTRVEWRYTDWGSKTVNWDGDVNANSKLTDTRVLTGLTYKPGAAGKFGERDAVVANWNGLYIGGQVGASAAHLRFGGLDDTDNEFADFTQLLAGGHIGYNWQFGNLVVGPEGDLNAKLGHGFKIDDQLRATSKWDASIRARLGWAATQSGLLYVTGGYAFGNFRTEITGADPGDIDGEHIGGSRHGWTVGGGIEYALNQNWSTRIEYRHTDWGTKVANGISCSAVDGCDINPAKLTDNRVQVGMSYRFSDWGKAQISAK